MLTTGGDKKSLTEAQRTSKTLAEHKRAMRALNDRDAQFRKPGSSGAMVTDLNNACEKDRLRTEKEKSEADLQAAGLLQLSKVAGSAGAAVTKIGTTAAILGAGPAAPAVVGAASAGTAVGAAVLVGLHDFFITMARSAPLRTILQEQTNRRNAEIIRIQKKAVREEVAKALEKWEDTALGLEEIKPIKAKIAQLNNQILRTKNKNDILKKIKEILNTIQQKAQEERDTNDPDMFFLEFSAFIEDTTMQKTLTALNTLIDTAKTLDPDFPDFPDLKIAAEKYMSFSEFEKSLQGVQKKVQENTRSGQQVKSRTTLKSKIETMQGLLAAERSKSEALTKARQILGTVPADIPADSFTTFKNKHADALVELNNLEKQAQLLDFQFIPPPLVQRQERQQVISQEKPEALGTLTYEALQASNRESEQRKATASKTAAVAQFSRADQLEKHLGKLKTAVDQESPPLGLTDLEQELAESLKKLALAEKNLKESIDLKEIFSESLVKLFITEKQNAAKTLQELTQDAKWAAQLAAQKALPTAQIVLHSAVKSTSAMTTTLTSSTAPTGIAADLTAKTAASTEANAEVTKTKAAAAAAEAVLNRMTLSASKGNDAPTIAAEARAAAAEIAAYTAYNTPAAVAANEAADQATAAATQDVSSVIAAASSVLSIKQAKADLATSLAETATTNLQQVQTRLTLSDIRNMTSILPEVKGEIDFIGMVCAAAEGMLKPSAADNDTKLIDLLLMLDACNRDEKFQTKIENKGGVSGTIAYAAGTAKASIQQMWEPNESFKNLIAKLASDSQLKDILLAINQTNSDDMPPNKLPKLWVETNRTINISKTTTNIITELTMANTNFSNINLNLGEHLNALEVLFSPYNNVEKKRFMLMAGQEQVDYFKKIVDLKLSVMSVSRALKQLTPTQIATMMSSPQGGEITRILNQLESTAILMEETIQTQLKHLENLENENAYRKPYINIFKNANDPSQGLDSSLRNAAFSDLLFLLTEENLSNFAISPQFKYWTVKTELAKEFCELYSQDANVNNSLDKQTLEAKRLEFLKKIANPPDPVTPEYELGLTELKGLWSMYLTNNTSKIWDYKDFKKSHADFTKGESLRFESTADFEKYLKENEQLYHSQRVLGIQKAALITSMQKDLKNELNLINKQLGRAQILEPKAGAKTQTEATPLKETPTTAQQQKKETNPPQAALLYQHKPQKKPPPPPKTTPLKETPTTAQQQKKETNPPQAVLLHQHKPQKKSPPPPPARNAFKKIP